MNILANIQATIQKLIGGRLTVLRRWYFGFDAAVGGVPPSSTRWLTEDEKYEELRRCKAHFLQHPETGLTWEQVKEHARAGVARGEKALNGGQVVTHDEAKRRMARWLDQA